MNAIIGFGVFYCIYEDILKICFEMFGKMSKKCEPFSYEGFFWIVGVCGVLNGPPPIPGVNVKVPFRGNQIWKIIFV